MTCADIVRLLPQYLDGELEDGAASRCGEHIAACEACRAHVGRQEALARLVQRAPYYTAPDGLRASITARVRRRRAVPAFAAIAATALLAVSAAIFAPRLFQTIDRRHVSDDGRQIAAEVVDEHVRALMSAGLFDVASTDQHTVKPWFLGKLDFSPPVVDLAAQGFPLQGGRVDYVGGRRVAALVYTRRQHAINVFVWPSTPPDAESLGETIRGFHVIHWTRGGMSLWAVSDLNEAELQQFVRLQNE